jgi:hypothetical protein
VVVFELCYPFSVSEETAAVAVAVAMEQVPCQEAAMHQGIGWDKPAEEENHHQIVAIVEGIGKGESHQQNFEGEPFEVGTQSCRESAVVASVEEEVVVVALALLYHHPLCSSLCLCLSPT